MDMEQDESLTSMMWGGREFSCRRCCQDGLTCKIPVELDSDGKTSDTSILKQVRGWLGREFSVDPCWVTKKIPNISGHLRGLRSQRSLPVGPFGHQIGRESIGHRKPETHVQTVGDSHFCMCSIIPAELVASHLIRTFLILLESTKTNL